MSKEELELFLIKVENLKNKSLLTLDERSKVLIERMNNQNKKSKSYTGASQKRKVASMFFPEA